MKKFIITGCTGTIGSAIVRLLVERKKEVVCIVHRGSKRLSSLPQSKLIKIQECNIDEYETLNLSGSYDCFIHLAWNKTFGQERDDVQTQLNNVQYTLDAVKLAKRCGCSVFVGAGSQAEYGIKDCSLTCEMSVNPLSGYGIAKYTSGKLANMLCRQIGIRFNWIRILSVYGINDAPYTLISYVIEELKNSRSPQLTKCEQIWDYIYCDDVARAFIAVAENGVNCKYYPLGSGVGRKLSDYIKDIQSIVAPNVKIQFGAKEYYPHQPMYLVADISELNEDTGWKPEIGFSDGIQLLLQDKECR